MAEHTQRPENGEGNHRAGREYQKRTKKFVESGQVDENAQEAREAIEDEEEGEELERARRKTKASSDRDEI